MDYSKFRTLDVTSSNIKFWIENDRNVLLFGKHGVGKSSIIMEGFEKNGLVKNKSYAMFSGSTLDPWIDFIGIPKKSETSDHIEFIRPEYMDENLEAIFMDEYNRAPKSVRNALMELSQFKSINGKRFPNLRLVWAACNPETGDYDTELLDPAQGDRFHIILNIPYKPSSSFFNSKYGEDKGNNAVTWWNDLPEDAKKIISPRRLDYALEYHFIGGDIREVLPINANIADLKRILNTEPLVGQIESFIKNSNWNEVKKILNDETNLLELTQHVFSNEKYYPIMANYISDEFLIKLLIDNDSFFDWAIGKTSSHNKLLKVFETINNSRDSYELSATKYKIMDKVMNYSASSDTFLVLNPYAPRSMVPFDTNNTKLPKTDSKKVLELAQTAMKTFGKDYKNGLSKMLTHQNIHEKFLKYCRHPKELSDEALLETIKLHGCLHRINDIDYNVLNILILEASNRAIISESFIRDSLGVLIQLSDTYNNLIIEESDTVDIGDVLLNVSGVKGGNNLEFNYED